MKGTLSGTSSGLHVMRVFKGELEGDLKGYLKGYLEGDFRGDFNQNLEGELL